MNLIDFKGGLKLINSITFIAINLISLINVKGGVWS